MNFARPGNVLPTFCAALCLLAASATTALAQPAPAPVPSPGEAIALATKIFQPTYRSAIDSRCPKAHADADTIAQDIATVDVNVLASAYHDLMDCSKLSRLPRAKDQTLYMQLGAAMSLYLIGTRTGGPTQKTALTYARQIIDVIAPDTRKLARADTMHSDLDDTADGIGTSYDPAVLRADATELAPLIDSLLSSLPK